jgi:hypothetical protein
MALPTGREPAFRNNHPLPFANSFARHLSIGKVQNKQQKERCNEDHMVGAFRLSH